MVIPTIVSGKTTSSGSQTNGNAAKPSYMMGESSMTCHPKGSPRTRTGTLCIVFLLGLSLATLVLGWAAVTNTAAVRSLRQEVALLSLAPPSQRLEGRILQLEAALLALQNEVDSLQNEEGGEDYEEEELVRLQEEAVELSLDEAVSKAPVMSRHKRSPETLRRPSRYMQRPVPVYNKAYGIDLKQEGEGLQLYSTLQGPFDANSVSEVSSELKPAQKSRRPPPASFLKSGDRIRRRRPRVKSLRQRNPKPSGGLVQNGDVLYRESLYKDTPGDDDWDAAVSKVRQGPSPAPLSLPAAPVPVTQRARKRPNKKNTRRRKRGARLTAAHFNGLPAAAGGSGTWEGAEWMEGLGLMSRYKTGGDHVLVADSGIYLIYAQVRFASGPSTGFDIRVNGRAEASCSQTGTPQPGTCFTAVVTYLPKNSVVRVESSSPQAPVLRLEDGEQASVGLIKLLEAPSTYHQLFTD